MGEKREPIFRGGENSAMKLSHINKVLLIINKSAFLFFWSVCPDKTKQTTTKTKALMTVSFVLGCCLFNAGELPSTRMTWRHITNSM